MKNSKGCVRMGREESEILSVQVGLRKVVLCIQSYLINFYKNEGGERRGIWLL